MSLFLIVIQMLVTYGMRLNFGSIRRASLSLKFEPETSPSSPVVLCLALYSPFLCEILVKRSGKGIVNRPH